MIVYRRVYAVSLRAVLAFEMASFAALVSSGLPESPLSCNPVVSDVFGIIVITELRAYQLLLQLCDCIFDALVQRREDFVCLLKSAFLQKT